MDEKDMVNGLPSVDDTVSDVPPEPEPPERYSYGEPSGEGEGTVQVSLQKEQQGASGPDHEYGEASQEGPESAADQENGYGDPQQGTPLPGNGYGGPQQEIPPSGNGYGGPQQETPPSGYGYGGGYGPGSGQGYGYGPQGYGAQEYQSYHTPKKNNNMALASLIVGVLSILLCCCGGFGIILGAVGIVLAILSRGREPMDTRAKVGCGLSIGGIILGIAVLVMAFAVLGSDGLRSELYQRSYGDYGDYSHYFEHGGMQ